jgi:hypothetical protein
VVQGRKPSKAEKEYAKAQNREAQNIILSGPIRRKPVYPPEADKPAKGGQARRGGQTGSILSWIRMFRNWLIN